MKNTIEKEVKFGDIFYVKLVSKGSIQGGLRPVLIIQNNIGNLHSPTTIIVPLTTNKLKHKLPTHVFISAKDCYLKFNSMLLIEQIQTINKSDLINKVSTLPPKYFPQILKALSIEIPFFSMIDERKFA